ncbi:valine--tRNA ligase [Ruminococcaceae bacterium OttesenSCG-928-O06]|nr:valine--tRNA ligase [Ruminococcaceae bacterium OttesenSCG-928-O06]
MKQLEKAYDPKQVEDATYQFWMDGGWFAPRRDAAKTPYTIVMPPPNITGQLHMGHAMDSTWQDILIRHKRMQGYAALWVPGTDHASIATEARIVAEMKAEGLTKEDLGREGFLQRAWKWKEEYGGRIVGQLKKLGSSCDWSRERFTMDEGCSHAVRHVFKRLYDEGLIYRGERIINWCPYCCTSISDAEVEHEEQEGRLWYIRYPVVGSDDFVEVATTRPETMLGDVAVAVNPRDERYRHLHGKQVILPLVGREIPVITDEYVDMEFGTGVVKITPGHDPNDFEVGRRHNLPVLKMMTEDAHITAEGGKYAGLSREDAREAVVADLEKDGFLAKIKPHPHNVGTCYRCGTTIEPMVSLQWFVKMEPLAKPAIEAVKDDTIQFVPERFTKTYLHWMENTRDWTISRQLWWGHRIPAWYCDECGEITVSETEPAVCEHCGSKRIHQDEDTLDTWFSSALWPFSTLGWPEKTEDLAYFYPTNTLVTGYDIIGFWVSRMIFSGLHHMGQAPFDTVLIHGLVRDAEGQKMSKSLGNGIDPLDVIEQYGADALRFTLVVGSTPGNDMRFSDEKVRASRNFANKLWNAARFVLMNLPEGFAPGLPAADALDLSDKWALSTYNTLVGEVTLNLERFEFGLAAQKVYDFIWDVLCDWTIEIAKPRLTGQDAQNADAARKVLVYLLDGALRLLHPFMPFITEEIYQALPAADGAGETIMTQPWPVQDDALDWPEEQAAFGEVLNLVRAVRAVRAEMGVHPAKRTRMVIETALPAPFVAGQGVIQKLAGAEQIAVVERFADEAAGMVQVATPTARVFVPMLELVDRDMELARLAKELAAAEKELAGLAARLENKGFVEKAPPEVVQEIRTKLERAAEKQARIQESIDALG